MTPYITEIESRIKTIWITGTSSGIDSQTQGVIIGGTMEKLAVYLRRFFQLSIQS